MNVRYKTIQWDKNILGNIKEKIFFSDTLIKNSYTLIFSKYLILVCLNLCTLGILFLYGIPNFQKSQGLKKCFNKYGLVHINKDYLEIFFWLQLFWLGIKYVFLALYSSIITFCMIVCLFYKCLFPLPRQNRYIKSKLVEFESDRFKSSYV